MEKTNGKFPTETRDQPEKYETGIFQLCFLRLADVTQTSHTDVAL